MPAKVRELLWECSNDFDTEIKYEKGSTKASANQGVCAGLAIEWCKNLLKGTRPESSKPFLLQGMIYQRFYDWGTNDAERNAKLFGTAGVTGGTRSKHLTAHTMARSIWPKSGVWWGGYSNHAVAVGKANDTWLFFDPNFGCYAVHSELRMTELFRQGRNAVGAANSMEFYPVTL